MYHDYLSRDVSDAFDLSDFSGDEQRKIGVHVECLVEKVNEVTENHNSNAANRMFTMLSLPRLFHCFLTLVMIFFFRKHRMSSFNQNKDYNTRRTHPEGHRTHTS
jgi:hypothetical protein